MLCADPECYLLGKERTGAAIDGRYLVIEDSPSGVRAGKAAGCSVLGLATTHSVQRVKEAGADWIVQDLRSANFVSYDGGNGEISLQISDALESP